MKDCHVYFKTICTCGEEGYCFDKEGGCEYEAPNKICLDCDNYDGDILKCYNCEKCKQTN